MVTANSTNLFIPFWEGSQVLSGHFIKRNLVNWSFHLVKYANLTNAVYILSRYTPVCRNVSKVVFFKVGWSDISWKKYCSFFKVNYLSSSIAEVSKFAPSSRHLQKAAQITEINQTAN